LRKSYIAPLPNSVIPKEYYSHPIWEKSSLVHNSQFTRGSYYVETIIETFRVEHREQRGFYTGYMAIGGIGGFAFWMLILHTIVMILVGFCFSKESKFLAGSGPERRQML